MWNTKEPNGPSLLYPVLRFSYERGDVRKALAGYADATSRDQRTRRHDEVAWMPRRHPQLRQGP